MKQMLRTIGRATALGLCLLACGSCSSTTRESRSPSYLVLDLLSAASGATPQTFSNVLRSDVITNVKNASGQLIPTVFEDNGQAILHFSLRDPTNPAGPSTTNEITITSYHVSFVRADGRNTPGVDVPYAFDGAATGTTRVGIAVTLNFTLVRAQAKLEPPLIALRGSGGSILIATIASVTFYGHDQAGNQVSVTGQIGVNFGDWGDPE